MFSQKLIPVVFGELALVYNLYPSRSSGANYLTKKRQLRTVQDKLVSKEQTDYLPKGG